MKEECVVQGLVHIRLMAGLTQVQLAKIFNIKQCTISCYERGRLKPSPKVAKLYLDLAKKHKLDYEMQNIRVF